MKYQINKENYRRFDVMAVNKLPERSYFIPFSSKEKADQATPLTKRYILSFLGVASCVDVYVNGTFAELESKHKTHLPSDDIHFLLRDNRMMSHELAALLKKVSEKI